MLFIAGKPAATGDFTDLQNGERGCIADWFEPGSELGGDTGYVTVKLADGTYHDVAANVVQGEFRATKRYKTVYELLSQRQQLGYLKIRDESKHWRMERLDNRTAKLRLHVYDYIARKSIDFEHFMSMRVFIQSRDQHGYPVGSLDGRICTSQKHMVDIVSGVFATVAQKSASCKHSVKDQSLNIMRSCPHEITALGAKECVGCRFYEPRGGSLVEPYHM